MSISQTLESKGLRGHVHVSRVVFEGLDLAALEQEFALRIHERTGVVTVKLKRDIVLKTVYLTC